MLGIIIHILLVLIAFAWALLDPSFKSVIAFLSALALHIKNEVYAILGSRILSLTPKNSVVKNLNKFGYSFSEDNPVNPRIIEDLDGWISDLGNQVVCINLSNSNESNRYSYDSIDIEETEANPVIKSTNGNSWYAYQLLGLSMNGVYILRTWYCGGGTGIFCRLIFLTISEDCSLSFNSKNDKNTGLVIKKIAQFSLGDRYTGNIKFKYGVLLIGKDKNSIPDRVLNTNKYLFVL